MRATAALGWSASIVRGWLRWSSLGVGLLREGGGAGRQVAVEGRDADAEHLGDRRHAHVLAHRLRRGDLVRCERRWSAADAAAFAGGCDAGAGPLADDLALELRERAEDVEGEPPAAGGGVDVLGQRPERDLARLELLDELDQVLEAAAEAVQAPDDERVAGLQEREALVELGPVFERSGADVAEDASAAGVRSSASSCSARFC